MFQGEKGGGNRMIGRGGEVMRGVGGVSVVS